ncbi:SDR family oxidoreductase [Bauldia sp.]|uniref:SDR family oxidoreductase n=1 Tax=Bauldia sp. TaxID=2575872 RepID=UPI003BAC19C1
MIDLSLNDRSLLVTGGTQGVGKAIAETAIGCGARAVLITGRDANKGQTAAADLSGRGAEVFFAPADLADRDAPSALFAAALDQMGPVDGLVNAAGATTRGSFVDGTMANWDELFDVNARAPFLLMQQLIRHLRERETPGSIVNISSINTHCGAPDLAMYAASKAALSTLTKNAANAHLADRIRVNAIAMGWAATPGEKVMQGITLGKGDGWIAAAEARMPLGRLLEAQEVANLAVYLLSDASGLQTGTVIDLEQRVIGAPP